MSQDFYKRICRGLDHLLKQYVFGLLNRDVREQIKDDVTTYMVNKPDVWHCDVNTFVIPGNKVIVHVLFSDVNDKVYKYIRKMN